MTSTRSAPATQPTAAFHPALLSLLHFRSHLEPLTEDSTTLQLLAVQLDQLDSALVSSSSDQVARQAVELTQLLSASRLADQSQPAYKAASRLSALLLMWSQVRDLDSQSRDRLALAMDSALREINAQVLLLKRDRPSLELPLLAQPA